MSAKRGVETAPSPTLGQVLCTVGPLLKYFPKTELSALHEASLSPKNLFPGKFRPLNQHILGICYCVKRKLQQGHYLTDSYTRNTPSCRRSHPTPSTVFFCLFVFLTWCSHPIPTAEVGKGGCSYQWMGFEPQLPMYLVLHVLPAPVVQRGAGIESLVLLQELHCQQHTWGSVTHQVTAQLRAQPSGVAAQRHLPKMLQTPPRGTKLPSIA